MSQLEQQPPIHLRVMVADDVWATIQSIRLMLKLLPDVELVATALDGRQAVDMAKTHKPDIALVDINMPELGGLLAIQKMLRHRPQMVCIIMSVEGQADAWREAQAHGASDYLVKPFTTEELVAAVERAGQMVINRRPEAKDTALLRRKLTSPLRSGQTTQLREKRYKELKQLASQYIKARRTDDEVIDVLEELAASPYCELHWLKWLAMIYVNRTKWEKLKILIDRLQQKTGTPDSA